MVIVKHVLLHPFVGLDGRKFPSRRTSADNLNEAVLWSGSPTASNVSINLSEPISGFERFAVEWRSYAR
ncbi:MAG: hypothetical protein IIW85_07365, partial [Bacteroidaceae bacterium]|nr:hypothetical protein [Bacteroidaceae bacterium]